MGEKNKQIKLACGKIKPEKGIKLKNLQQNGVETGHYPEKKFVVLQGVGGKG